MKELIPYIFEHPQYGKLRVVVDNFCDEKVVADMVDAEDAKEKLAAKWVLGYVKKSLNDPMMSVVHAAQGVAMISDNTILEPINIYMDVAGRLTVNDQIFE